MRVHLLDGTWELHRTWFASPRATAADGREVGAVRGLIASLAAFLRDPDVTHVGIAFDTVIESFRNERFAGYKTSEGMEPELLAQFGLAERAAAALGLVVWPMRDFEADDALATAAVRAAADPRVEQVLLCSPDKDLAQCVDGRRIVQFDRQRGVLRDVDGVVEKFGVEPASIPDWLALVGDAADGLPGVPRWGAKSSSTVLAHYRHLEAIPDSPDDWEVPVRGRASLAAQLAEHREAALLYRELATLRVDVPLAESVDDLRWSGPDTAGLETLAAELGSRPPRLPLA